MKFGVVVFPGSNCDADVFHVVRDVLQQSVDYIWHESTDVSGYDCIVLPGGFSYGDYLRAGAIARFAPVMPAIRAFAEKGGLVLGICNGFQILLEAGLLPGAMLRNKSVQFRCEWIHMRVEQNRTPFTSKYRDGEIVRMPIAHGEGNYYTDKEMLAGLERRGQIVFRYCDSKGQITAIANPNGTLKNIAGICNERGNVLGLMPHPERCSELLLGGSDGLTLWQSALNSLMGNVRRLS